MENFPKEAGKNVVGLEIDEALMFSDHKNVFKPRIKKRQLKLAEKVRFLKRFLDEDERVVCITTGCSPMNMLEQFLMGGLKIRYVKRSLFVFTNRRVFHIPTKTDYSYRYSIAQILYGDCQSLEIKGRSLVVRYADATKEKFHYLAGSEKKKIKAYLANVQLQGQQSVAKRRHHLCPRCTGQLGANESCCPNCQLMFKDKAEARKISLIFPGGGYFYTRHPYLGVGDAVAEAYLTFLLIVAFMGAIKGQADYFPVIFVGTLLGIEKAVTVYDSNKFIEEFIPLEKEIEEKDILRADQEDVIRKASSM